MDNDGVVLLVVWGVPAATDVVGILGVSARPGSSALSWSAPFDATNASMAQQFDAMNTGRPDTSTR